MKKKLLLGAVILCLAFAGIRVVEFGLTRVPPYAAGTCLHSSQPFGAFVQVRIVKNHILQAYSDVEISTPFSIEDKLKVPFQELRAQDDLVKGNCF